MLNWVQDSLSKLAALVAAFFSGFFTGVLREKNKRLKQENKGLRDAKEIHDRVERDDAYRDSVRDKYR